MLPSSDQPSMVSARCFIINLLFERSRQLAEAHGIPNVKSYFVKGRRYAYFRPNGQRLHATWLSRTFFAELRGTQERQSTQQQEWTDGTLSDLIAAFEKSSSFARTPIRSRAHFQSAGRWLTARFASKRFDEFDKQFALQLRDRARRGRGAYFANTVIALLKILAMISIEKGLIEEDPFKDVRRLVYAPPLGSNDRRRIDLMRNRMLRVDSRPIPDRAEK